ncbi:MAG: CDP-diacylglycerol--glycerol-3-phosphate 3-phosphatidyltransferase [Oscillospiraceae bacterium]|nr:CDP-diacylglycerol--glycerol-3-phosphate 3-phosphatidyltransferase [Oscillospiraceae bacterium]
MNTPNKLTLLRIILIPAFVIFLLMPEDIPLSYLWAGLIFGAASLTDYFDGKIARARNLITDFGKLMDPVADKLLVAAAFICFIANGLASPWTLIIILAREFLVTSVRMVSASRGVVIPANNWGKAKTVSQIVAIILVMVLQLTEQLIYAGILPDFIGVGCTGIPEFVVIGHIGVWISAILTLISGAVYIWQSRELFKDIK